MQEQQTTKATLASAMGETINVVDPNALYLVDFNKMNSVNDLVLIMSCLGISFSGSHPHIEKIKDFLNLENPIPVQAAAPQPQRTEMKLPKLKKVD
jgi:hypothetical protein